MAKTMYRVEDVKCPVIVVREDGETERCDEAVWLRLWVGESGRGYGFCECSNGHEPKAMGHDLALDLDGVPVVA